MIEYSPRLFIVAHWFVDQPSAEYRKLTGVANMNWIACVWREPSGLHEVRWRFSYFDDRERHVRSNWHGMKERTLNSTPIAKFISGMDMMARMTSRQNGDAFWERVDLNLPGDKALDILLQKDWMRIVATSSEMN